MAKEAATHLIVVRAWDLLRETTIEGGTMVLKKGGARRFIIALADMPGAMDMTVAQVVAAHGAAHPDALRIRPNEALYYLGRYVPHTPDMVVAQTRYKKLVAAHVAADQACDYRM
jgi:hypothetical protein